METILNNLSSSCGEFALSFMLIMSLFIGFAINFIKEHVVSHDEFEDRDDPYAIPLQHNSTCNACVDWWCCSYVGDLYNINGDCIDEK